MSKAAMMRAARTEMKPRPATTARIIVQTSLRNASMR
jgi:hypothetical protein